MASKRSKSLVKHDELIAFRCPSKWREKLEEQAKLEGKSLSQLIVEMCDFGLKRTVPATRILKSEVSRTKVKRR